jgi:copper chaperone NosL
MRTSIVHLCVILLSLFLSCKSGPQPISFGNDACSFCKMTAVDPKFGAEIVTKKGKIYIFDDVNCMVQFLNEKTVEPGAISQMLAIDFNAPGQLINVHKAYFLKSGKITSPMSSGIAAFSSESARYDKQQHYEGEPLTWDQVIRSVQ